MSECDVIIVGGGPAGMATSACLNRLGVSNIVLEREDCCASLWKKRAYDRLKLHLAKQYCNLPHMPFPQNTPTFVPKSLFVRYLDDYAQKFNVLPKYNREVVSVYYDMTISKWSVVVKDSTLGVYEAYFSEFLVVATGENSLGFIPSVHGIEGFGGKVLHSSEYENGKRFKDKNVLVVGSGNSGMEIAFDLSNWNANTSIVVRGPVHLVTENIVRVGMFLLKFLPMNLVDNIALILGRLRHGDVSKYGFQKPLIGPFTLKAITGKSPTIDVGTINKIKSGDIKIYPAILSIEGNNVIFENGQKRPFDAIIFATGFKSTVRNWLRGGNDLFNEKGMPKQRFPNEYWKGKNGIYSAGFSSRGLNGISQDAINISNDIFHQLSSRKNNR